MAEVDRSRQINTLADYIAASSDRMSYLELIEQYGFLNDIPEEQPSVVAIQIYTSVNKALAELGGIYIRAQLAHDAPPEHLLLRVWNGFMPDKPNEHEWTVTPAFPPNSPAVGTMSWELQDTLQAIRSQYPLSE